MEMENLEKSHLFTMQNAVKQIAQPLFDLLDIDYFVYGKLWKDDTASFLTTYPELSSALIKQGCGANYYTLKNMSENMPNVYSFYHNLFYISRDDNLKGYQLARKFGIGDIVVLFEKTDQDFEGFAFGTKVPNATIRTVFSRPDILVRYKYNFLDKATKLIKHAFSNRVRMNSRGQGKQDDNGEMMVYDPEKLSQELNPKHYHVLHNGKRIGITRREFQCLRCLAQGQTLQEAANNIGIGSWRTVDTYLRNLQNKLNMPSKKALREFYLSTDLILL